MRAYTPKEPTPLPRNWALELREYGLKVGARPGVEMTAVDIHTGDIIAFIMSFKPSGDVVLYGDVDTVLTDEGYDPKEHGNEFDEMGRMKVVPGTPGGEVEEEEPPF